MYPIFGENRKILVIAKFSELTVYYTRKINEILQYTKIQYIHDTNCLIHDTYTIRRYTQILSKTLIHTLYAYEVTLQRYVFLYHYVALP